MERKCVRPTFRNIFWFWIAATLAISFLNAAVIRDSWLLSSLVRSGLGITLLLYPVCPEAFVLRWGVKKSRSFIRMIAGLEILVSFCVRIYTPA